MGFLDGLSAAAGGVLSSGIGAISSGIGSIFNAREASKNRKFQERMYKQQYQDSIDFWNMQNQYNLPSAQLERLKDAGLNPLLMYGDGGISGNIAQGTPQLPSAPKGAQASANLSAMVPLANLGLLKAQKENIEADSMLKLNEAMKATSEKIKNLQDVDWNRETWALRKDQIAAEISLKAAYENTEVSKRNEIESNIAKATSEIDLINAEISNKNRLTEQEINESNNRIKIANEQSAAAIAKMNAEARKAEADALYARCMSAIIGQPEYIRNSQKLKAEELRKAIAEGNQAEIEAGLAGWMYDMRPKPGSSSYEYKMWIDHWVTPVTESLGKLLGGSASYSFPAKKR